MSLESPSPTQSGWPASLDLVFERRERTTRLVSNRHAGPLRLIRALPAPDGSCHAVLIHPPGGLVNGDTLDIALHLGESAHVLCTTPGAQKWYRSAGPAARSTTTLQVGRDAMLEWLPHPAIVYDGARAEQQIAFELGRGARMIGWECLVLGRRAMGERFRRGSLRQGLSLRVDGRLAWSERTVAQAGDRLFDSPVGWRGHCVAATVWAVGLHLPALLEDWRAALHEPAARRRSLEAAATQLEPGLLLARLLADEAEPAMEAARELWAVARRAFTGAATEAPRIWAT